MKMLEASSRANRRAQIKVDEDKLTTLMNLEAVLVIVSVYMLWKCNCASRNPIMHLIKKNL